MSDAGQHRPKDAGGSNPRTSDTPHAATSRDPTKPTPSETAFSIAIPRLGGALDGDAAAALAVRDTVPITPKERSQGAARPTAGRWDPFRLPVIDKESYEVAGEVAQGGNGRILRARDGLLDRPVALKELLSGGGPAEERFVFEALLTARLQHPSIVPVYEAGRWPTGEPFYAMKLVSGRSLADVIRAARTLDARLSLLPHVLAVAEAMAYAHSEHIIHRDLKPANILVGDFGETVVIDWGLAKDLAATGGPAPAPSDSAQASAGAGEPAENGLTLTGAIMGTPAYMPLEQAQGETVDERADVYALGAILYHVLAGEPPYDGSTAMDILQQLFAGPPPALQARQRGVPEDLRAIVDKAMARERVDRYPTARELSDDLRRFQTGQIVAAHHYSTVELVQRFVRRYRTALAVALVALIILAGVGSMSVRRIIEARDSAAARQREAEAAQREAVRRADDLTLVQARTALDEDPNRALAWLKTLSPSFDNWAAARIIAADAQSRGLSTILRGHTKAVGTFDFSPDGTTIATASDDGTVRLWDRKTGQGRIFTRHKDEAWWVSFSHDGKTLASGCLDGTIRLSDIATGTSRELAGHTGGMMFLEFSADDRQLFSTGDDKTLRRWDIAGGTHQTIISADSDIAVPILSPDHAHAVGVDRQKIPWLVDTGSGMARQIGAAGIGGVSPRIAAAFSPDSRIIATGHLDHTVRLWELPAVKERVLAGHTGPVERVAFSHDGKWLASAAADRSVRLWDMTTGRARVFEGHSGPAMTLVFSPDGKWLASASLDHTVRLWDLPSGTGRVLSGFDDAALAAQFSPDSETLAASSGNGAVRLWSLHSTASHTLATHHDSIIAVEFSPDGTLLATADKGGTIRLSRPAGGDPIVWKGHSGSIGGLAFAPDGKHIATSAEDGTARIWSDSGGLEQLLHAPLNAKSPILFSPDQTWLASAGTDNAVHLWNVSSGEDRVLSGHQGDILTLAFSPDSQSIASAGSDGTVRLWNIVSGQSRVLRGHSGIIFSLDFSPTGETLVSGSRDHTIRLWDLAGDTASRMLPVGGLIVRQTLFSPDGKSLIVMPGDNTVHVLSAETLQVQRMLRGHEDLVERAALSRDGRTLATASRDRTVRLWDLQTGESRALREHTDAVRDVKFSPDGRHVVSISLDKTARLWVDDLPLDPAGLRAWLDATTPETIELGRRPPPASPQ
jgi:WD40 repeat protein